MELKKVVMPGVKPATAQPTPVQKPTVGGIPVVKPAGIQPVVKPAVAQVPNQVPVQTVQPSVTTMSKDDRLADVKNATAKVKAKSAINEVDNDENDEEVVSKPVKKKFTGPRKVVVYGRELFVEEDPNVSLDDIRERIVNEYEFPEFAKERTQMSLDEATGIVVPVISFQKKG